MKLPNVKYGTWNMPFLLDLAFLFKVRSLSTAMRVNMDVECNRQKGGGADIWS